MLDRGRQDPRGPARHRGVGGHRRRAMPPIASCMPGFVDTHQPFLSRHPAQHPAPTACSTPTTIATSATALTPAYRPSDVYAGVLVTALGMIDMPAPPRRSTPRRSTTRPSTAMPGIRGAAGIRASARSTPIRAAPGPGTQVSAGHRPPAADLRSAPSDQLLTLALGGSPRCENLRGRARGRRAGGLARASAATPSAPWWSSAAPGLLQPRRRIHPLQPSQRRSPGG